MPLWKRVLVIIGFTAIVLLLGFLVYAVFFRPPAPQKQVAIPPAPSGGLPTSGEYVPSPSQPIRQEETRESGTTALELPTSVKEGQGGPVRTEELFADPAVNMQRSPDGQGVVAYDALDGRFYRIDRAGPPEKLSDQTFFGAQDIQWSPNSDKAAIEFADGSNIVYDFGAKKQVTLPGHWTSFDFGPRGDSLSFKSIGEDPDNRWFAVANSDGTGARVLEDLGDKAGLFTASWSPSGHIAGYFREGVDFDRQNVYFIGLHKENFKSITVNGRGLETEWSPDGTRLLHSVYSSSGDFRPELWIVDAIGERIGANRRRLNLNTWAHKCSFGSAEILYCAVPASLPEGAGLMPSVGDAGEDHIYRIDLANGERTKIAEPESPHTIDRIIVTDDQSVLYFTDKKTGSLFSIKL